MNRRQFSLSLPGALATSSVFGQSPTKPALQPLSSGVFHPRTTSVAGEGRSSQAFLSGMLSAGLRLEAHESVLEPGAPPESTRNHLHHEIWLMKEGTVELYADGKTYTMKAGDLGLCIAGNMHYIKNIGPDRASYFVLAVGPPE